MRFGVLGPVVVWSSDASATTIPGLKVRALLAALLIHEGRPVSADRLIDDLWSGEGMPGNPSGAFHSKVSQLRRALDEVEPGARDLVESDTAGYRLRVCAESVDARRFSGLLIQARETENARRRVTVLTEALALWRGPAFSEMADMEFVRGSVLRLDEQRLTALEDLAEARLEVGEHTLLVGELSDLLAQHPLRERLLSAQLRALYGTGRQGEALDVYQQHRRYLRDELGLDPGAELVELHQAILEQDPELSRGSSPSTPTPHPATNLPVPISESDGELFGRDAAITDVRTLLDTARLVTLTGPGGVGKTRLAIEVARAGAPRHGDGPWFVELGSHRAAGPDPAEGVRSIAAEVSATLGIREDSPGRPSVARDHLAVTDRLATALRARNLLLVLDNCEHLIEPVAHLVEHLLTSAPGLQVLVTSREPLGLSGEVVFGVSPLELPAPGASLSELSQASAVRLFVTRARAAAPEFALSSGNAEAVAEISRRLDGIPLALELAATRVRTLGVGELVARLDDRFRLLASGHRTAPQRQQTLAAMIDWSWELLAPIERVVLRRLAVHVGGCTLEAAELVSAGGDIAAPDVLDVLGRLVDRSLVAVAVSGDGSARRYRLLESVAAYCEQRLDEAGESASVRDRHLRYYADLAERVAPPLRGHGQREALARLDAEAGNMRAALETAARVMAADDALRLVNSLGWYWFLRGRHAEARRCLTSALAIGPQGKDLDTARTEALTWLAGVAFTDYSDDAVVRRSAVLGRYDELDDPAGRAWAQWLFAFTMLGSSEVQVVEQLVSDALAGFRALRDRWGIAAALVTRAEYALVDGDLAGVRRDSEESLALFDELGDRWGRLRSTRHLGALAEISGDYSRAFRLHRDALRSAEDLELWPVVSIQLASLGRVSLLVGEMTDATEYHQQAHRLAQEQSDVTAAAYAATGLALGERRQGQLDLAEERLRSLLDWHRRTGYGPGAALVLAELGFVAEQRGDAANARALHTEGLAAARETDDIRAVALAIEGLAGAASLDDEHAEAARLLGAAAAARQTVAAPLPSHERGDVDRITHRVRSALGGPVFDAEHSRGSQRSIDTLP